jgi:hypothetical protein
LVQSPGRPARGAPVAPLSWQSAHFALYTSDAAAGTVSIRLPDREIRKMITRRTLLLYNFGIAGLLAFIGAMSILGADASQIKRLNDLPSFNAEARGYITDEQDIEKLRARALFYFDVARDLKRARTDDSQKLFKDASTLAFFVAALFAAAGGMQLLYARARKKAGLVE